MRFVSFLNFTNAPTYSNLKVSLWMIKNYKRVIQIQKIQAKLYEHQIDINKNSG
jgi:hypothetical protein